MSAIAQSVVNIDELKLEHFKKGQKFEFNSARVGPLLGAMDLGYSYDVVPPGKRSCPFHSHRGEEEMFVIVRGTDLLRYGNETRPIRAGDVICCPCGGPEAARMPQRRIVIDTDALDRTHRSVGPLARHRAPDRTPMPPPGDAVGLADRHRAPGILGSSTRARTRGLRIDGLAHPALTGLSARFPIRVKPLRAPPPNRRRSPRARA